jgi:Ca2+/Na+ antiporter
MSGTLRTTPTATNPDLPFLFLFTLLALLMLRTERTIRRWEGSLLLGSYVGYLGWLMVKG